MPWWIGVASSLTNINCYSVKTNTNTVKSHFLALPRIDFVITHRNSWILFHLFHYQIKFTCEFVFCLVSNRLQFRKLFLQIKTPEMTNKIVSSLYLMWIQSKKTTTSFNSTHFKQPNKLHIFLPNNLWSSFSKTTGNSAEFDDGFILTFTFSSVFLWLCKKVCVKFEQIKTCPRNYV